ncbi:MAG: four-helix bundle copper-binding protein [Chitinophagales bacterium]
MNNQELSRKLADCIAACENCATQCLNEENIQMHVKCIKTDRDCADICALTLKLVNRNSHQLNEILKVCIVTCIACEQECRKHDRGHCQKCADACHTCHQACEEYLSVAA